MAKKTRAQKKKADDRKVYSPIAPYTEAAPKPLPTNNIAISGLSLSNVKSTETANHISHPFLKMDLMRVAALAIGAVVVEYVVGYVIKHGALSSWGIS